MVNTALAWKIPAKTAIQRSERPSNIARLPVGDERLRDLITCAVEEFWSAVKTGDKKLIQQAHIVTKNFETEHLRNKAMDMFAAYQDCFIDGSRLEPSKVDPSLIIVEPRTKEENLFRIARWTWSMPYSAGYGRRLRFVVWDNYHQAVIGIIGLQSPPVDLGARDALFDYPIGAKIDLINQTMDAYTIGAVPPYSHILGGKLVAGLVASNEVREAYWNVYHGRKTIMQGNRIERPMVAITTTSAFGRSSIYNRLKYKGNPLAHPIGYTKGMGSVHLDAFYPYLLEVVRKYDGAFDIGGYGNGPKLKWQHMKRALDLLQIERRYFTHGLQREVFLYRLVENLERGMSGGKFGKSLNVPAGDFANYWLARWALPRSTRNDGWRTVVAGRYFPSAILNGHDGA